MAKTFVKVNLENIPKNNNGQYSWKESVGKRIPFIYGDLFGTILIKDYIKKTVLCYNELNGKEKYISCRDILKGQFIKFVKNKVTQKNNKICDNNGKKQSKRKPNTKGAYKIGDIIYTDKKKYKVLGVSYKNYNHCDSSTLKNQGAIFYLLFCFDCKQIIWRSSYSLKRGCPVCANKKVVELYNDIPTTAPWMIDYFQDGYNEAKQYTRTSLKKIIPKCPVCGTIHDKECSINNIFSNHGFRCNNCSDSISYPEKFMMNLLTQLDIDYKFQVEKSVLGFDTNKKVYDFYIKDLSCIIETHGIQHYEEVNNFQMSLYEQQQNDRLKKQIALNNGIQNYYEINCRISSLSWIKKSIIESGLLSFLNPSNIYIDWNKCAEYATSNITKIVCDYYNQNDVSIQDLIKKFKIGKKGIGTYLKKGAELGWCKYVPSYDFFSCKPFEIYKDNNLICYGKGAKIFSRISQNVLGEYIDYNWIQKCLHKKIEQYHGYHFKYIDDLNLRREVLSKDDSELYNLHGFSENPSKVVRK